MTVPRYCQLLGQEQMKSITLLMRLFMKSLCEESVSQIKLCISKESNTLSALICKSFLVFTSAAVIMNVSILLVILVFIPNILQPQNLVVPLNKHNSIKGRMELQQSTLSGPICPRPTAIFGNSLPSTLNFLIQNSHVGPSNK